MNTKKLIESSHTAVEVSNILAEGLTDDIRSIARNNDGNFKRFLQGFLQMSKRKDTKVKLDKETLNWLGELYSEANGSGEDISKLIKDNYKEYASLYKYSNR